MEETTDDKRVGYLDEFEKIARIKMEEKKQRKERERERERQMKQREARE